ncbi:MAG TPA: hypothetical protein VIM00_02745 [Candidatus Acidoferrum sp.]|jgi:hypothetical protein
MMLRRLAAVFIVLLLVNGLALAGGPLRVTGRTAAQPGQPFVWPTGTPIRYTVDSGPLSATPSGQTVISNAQGLARVQSLFQNWQSVPTASLAFSYAGPITGVPGGDVKTIQNFNTVQGSCKSGAQNPIIFDANGSLFRALGLDPLVIGFAGTCKLDTQAGHILSAMVALNGQFQDGLTNQSSQNPEITAQQFDEAITHELGHFLGLGHSQVNEELFQSFIPGNCNKDQLAGLPLMFPIEFCQSRKSAGLPILAPDDVAWISKLYPASSFATSYGTLSGFVLFSDGLTAAQGVNVVARRVDDPATAVDESQSIAFSVVSGYSFTGNPGQSITGDNTGGSTFGSRNPALIGYYEIPVTPGNYTLQIENIDPSFTGGSSVGPLDPPTITIGAFAYWHHYESAFDNPAQRDAVTVVGGQKVSNLNFILNGTPPRFDEFEDGEVLLRRQEPTPFLLREPELVMYLDVTS